MARVWTRRVVRWALRLFIVASLLAAGAVASTAWNQGTVQARTVTLALVGDASAYLAIAGNGAHACFVSTTNGATTLNVDASCGAGYGHGLAAGDGTTAGRSSKMDLNDVLLVTDKGERAVSVWVNATTTSGSGSAVLVQTNATAGAGQMTDGGYSAAASVVKVGVGESFYVGVQVDSGALASGSAVSGAITLDARATT
jgi:hypothetical protein